jgi:hypothetical protein
MSWPNEGPGNWRCDVCGRVFAKREHRDEHERDEHGGPGGQETTQENLAGDQARQPEPRTSTGE